MQPKDPCCQGILTVPDRTDSMDTYAAFCLPRARRHTMGVHHVQPTSKPSKAKNDRRRLRRPAQVRGSHFFIGRQKLPPYAYDRRAPLRPSNVIWLTDDNLDRKIHDQLYRQEVEDDQLRRANRRALPTQRRGKKRATLKDTIDLTTSDADDGNVIFVRAVGERKADSAHSSLRPADRSPDLLGKELRAVFVGPRVLALSSSH